MKAIALLVYFAVLLWSPCVTTGAYYYAAASAGGGGGTVTPVDFGSTAFTGDGITASATVNLTVSSLTNGCMIICAALGDTSTTTLNTVTPTVGGSSTGVTLIGSVQAVGGSGNGKLAFWRLLNPSAGATAVVVTASTAVGNGDALTVYVQTYSNVNQTTPVSNVTQTNGNSTTASRTVTSTANSRVVAATNGGSTYSAHAATNRGNANTNTLSGGGCSSYSDRAGSASEVMSWTLGSDSWACIGFSLDPP